MTFFRLISILLVTASLGLSACNDGRPKYMRPLGQLNALVELKSESGGYAVTDVDGARVDSFQSSFSGNSVVLQPGERRVTIQAIGSNSSQTWGVVYNFQAGHRYTFGKSSFIGGLQITDQTTNTSVKF
ncbi:MAG TPA: hypothetical protein VGN72_22095 [Tepidisphaeraceae bacterium]|nr:hypothetical protein [Tepidisphaeraceae bacterium]